MAWAVGRKEKRRLDTGALGSSAAPPPAVATKMPRAGKGAGKVTASAVELSDVLPQIARLCLNSAQKLRDVQAALFITFLVSATGQIAPHMTAEARSVVKERQDERKAVAAREAEAKEGPEVPIHLYVFIAMLEGIIAELGEEEVELNADLAALQAKVEGMDSLNACRLVPHCRCEKTFSSKTKKVVYQLTDDIESKKVATAIMKCGGQLKLGRAPPGVNETEVAKALGSSGPSAE